MRRWRMRGDAPATRWMQSRMKRSDRSPVFASAGEESNSPAALWPLDWRRDVRSGGARRRRHPPSHFETLVANQAWASIQDGCAAAMAVGRSLKPRFHTAIMLDDVDPRVRDIPTRARTSLSRTERRVGAGFGGGGRASVQVVGPRASTTGLTPGSRPPVAVDQSERLKCAREVAAVGQAPTSSSGRAAPSARARAGRGQRWRRSAQRVRCRGRAP
jgi:hypothetical protein